MGIVFNGIHVLGQDPVDCRPVLCKFLRMGSCASLVVDSDQLPVHDADASSAFFVVFCFLLFCFAFPGPERCLTSFPHHWPMKDFCCVFQRQRTLTQGRRGLRSRFHLSRADILVACFHTNLCLLVLILMWTLSF